jgi:hypothetical protein
MNWYDIEATPGETDGWGVDETEFTTTLNKSAFTSDQMMMAEAMAAEIEGKASGGRRGGRSFDGGEDEIGSAEDAMELRRRQHQARMAAGGGGSSGGSYGAFGGGAGAGAGFGAFGGGFQQQQAAAPVFNSYGGRAPAQQARGTRAAAPTTGRALTVRQKDEATCQFLRGKVQWVHNVLREHGNPSPQMASKFLLNFGDKLKVCFPNPPEAVKKAVVASFLSVGWDVIKRTNVPRSKPPPGTKLLNMVDALYAFFQRRIGSNVAQRGQRQGQQQQQRRGQQQQRQQQQQRGGRGGPAHQQYQQRNQQGSRHQGQAPRRQERRRGGAQGSGGAGQGNRGAQQGQQQQQRRRRRGRGGAGGAQS